MAFNSSNIIYLGTSSFDVTVNGYSFRFSAIINILAGMNIAEVYWNGTTGHKLGFDGTSTILTNMDEFVGIIEAARLWGGWKWGGTCLWNFNARQNLYSSASWDGSEATTIKARQYEPTLLQYTGSSTNLENFLNTTGETSLEIPDDLLFQWYDPATGQSYKIQADGSKTTTTWDQGKRLYDGLDTWGTDAPLTWI